MKRSIGLCLLQLILVFSFCSCMTFTDFQSAKTVGKGNLEITPHVTGTFSEEVRYPTTGLNLAYGITDQFDLRASVSTNLILTSYSISPKINLVKDILSFNFPIGTFSSNSDLSIDRVIFYQPTLLITMPINKAFDLTFAPQYVLLKNENSGWQKPFFAPNMGLSIHRPGSTFTLRPEFGATFWPENIEYHLGIGFSFKLEKKFKQNPTESVL